MAIMPLPPGWTREDVERLIGGQSTPTDELLAKARSIKQGFAAAANHGGLTDAVFSVAATLADLCVGIVDNQRRLEDKLKKLTPVAP